MWSVLTRLMAIACTAAAVKIMDDALDRDLDLLSGRITLTASLENSSSAYVGILLVLGALLAPQDTLSLFIAAYIVGMARSPKITLPWGARAWQESLLVALAGWVGLGYGPMVSALLSMLAIQMVDDLIDGFPQRAMDWLPEERAVAAVGLIVLSALVDPVKAGAVWAVSAGIWLLEGCLQKRQRQRG